MSDNIKVSVRLRKPLERESAERVIAQVVSENLIKVEQRAKREETRNFEFDLCCTYSESLEEDQAQLYEQLARDYLLHALDGYNTCIFAYGQTGSGKSHTMTGSAELPGIVPRMCQELFEVREMYESSDDQASTQFKIRCSYLEIYNETVRDLLGANKCRIRERADKTTFVEGLQEFEVNSVDEILDYLRQGSERKTVGATLVNEQSSRSHTIFTINVEQKENSPLGHVLERRSSIRLIDLAGSERANASGATGERLKEGSNINKSLSTLGRVIAMLAKKKQPRLIPYRDAALTWVLKESLGGNSKTCMIACVSPCDFEETMSTLRYATLARSVKTFAQLNTQETVDGKVQMLAMRQQLDELQGALSRVGDQRLVREQMEKIKLTNQFLEARIERERRAAVDYYSQYAQASSERDNLVQVLSSIVSSLQSFDGGKIRESLVALKQRSEEIGKQLEADHLEIRGAIEACPSIDLQ
ncbi:kinesin family protein [Lachancea thermotolerans CBS 6340]|uniref:Kinesin-like protein n=1 Tax=Lachancea thermotolerans (strain ATCC 56472 / CBS 6340 / NRRL Y-8284) TaxID=559295 RepID=C5DLV5_LACTC|nr:KLTH0G03850p [Lachancea thermotolerans CBS 6340]CAR24766.1 KLTH0G03850p [Lachancea thermotolerans CBS 6340]